MNEQIVIPISAADEVTLQNFLGKDNGILLGELDILARGMRACNVLFLWGDRGCGKTHLLNASCGAAREYGKRGVYLNMQQQATNGDSMLDLDNLTPETLVCIDDLDCVADSASQQQSLFAVYERVIGQGGAILVSASKPLKELNLSLKDLESRLSVGGIYQISELSDAEKCTALQQRAENRGFRLANNVMAFILSHYSRDTRSLFALLDRLDNASLRNHRKITIPFIKSLIQ